MDWIFREDNRICHVRVAGVLIRENKILLQKLANKNEYALLGGHLKFGETTEQAIVREFREEIGLEVKCRKLLWTEENFWKWNKKDAHNIGFYYLVETAEDIEVSNKFTLLNDNKNVLFGWISIDELSKINVFPQFLKTEIHDRENCPKHFVRGK